MRYRGEAFALKNAVLGGRKCGTGGKSKALFPLLGLVSAPGKDVGKNVFFRKIRKERKSFDFCSETPLAFKVCEAINPMNKATDGKLVLLGEDNSGRDEMNLAGNPFALLQAASRNGQSFIHNEWERTLPDGRVVIAKWDVNGHAELGLPGPNEELLYLVLLQITKESSAGGEWPRQVFISRLDVLNRLGWDNSAGRYKELMDCFVRLKTVAINTRYSFWDAKNKTPFASKGFGIIDDYEFSDEPKGRKAAGTIPISWFRWNETLHESFLAGNVRSVALDFVLSLDLATSRRLFRFLDMMRGATVPPRREFAIGLFKLCERLGMSSYKYASKVKEKLKPAIDELKERGYLEDVRYEKSKDGTEIAYFAFGSVKQIASEQGRAEQGSAAPPVEKPNKSTTKSTAAPPSLIVEKSSDVREDALKCHTVFRSLSEEEQIELLNQAKEEVSPIWHDRVGVPESPMSLGLWQLVAKRYPERCK